VQLALQVLPVRCVALDVGVKGLLSICIHLLFVHSQQIKGDVVTVAFDCHLEELNLELGLLLIHEL
jgi:hypothetical protein